MKKYLIMSAVALAVSASFIGCKDKDLFDPIANEQAKLAFLNQYRDAFVAVFGQPASNQDWGFGDASASSRMTRAIQPSYNFPADADPSKFLADVPAGVAKLTENVGRANNYIDETWQGDLNIWGGATEAGNWQDRSGGTLYIKGNCNFTNRRFYFDGHSELYLVEGATLTLNATDAANLQTYTNIYMAANSKIVTTNELKLNNGLHIFNHGTIEAGKLSTNSDSWLVNGGTVKITGKISVENTLSVIVNNGIIEAADLNTAGSGKFMNNADVTISGTTFVNSNDNTWVNNGQYHTGNFIYNAASDEVINNCRLTVDEDFNINLGDNPGNGNFKMDAGSGVVTKNFNGGGNWAKNYSTGWNSHNGGPFFIYMGAGSVFKVTETATMNATKADYGIYGPTTGTFAVFQAKNIVAGAAYQGYEVTYGNNLYVSAESHFANGMSGQYPYIDFKGNAKIFAPGFEDGKPAVKIEETECNPGFEGTTVEPDPVEPDPTDPDPVYPIDPTDPNPTKIRVMAEDLSATEASDFDFNDVVFDAEYVSPTQAKITLWAAGGTLPLRINSFNGVGGFEVHDVFNVDVTCMVNTHAKDAVVAGYSWVDNLPVYETTINITGGTFDQNNFPLGVRNLIRIEVFKNNAWHELTANKGQVACKLATPVGTQWMIEKRCLKNGYPMFEDYVGYKNNATWYSVWYEKNTSLLYGENGMTTICNKCQ